MENKFIVEVWGDFACFTRPEMKVERFSYPVMTPSSARGIMDAIYAKPIEFSWRIDRIEILNPIQYIALKRNEVKEKVSVAAVKKYMGNKELKIEPINVDATKEMAGTDQKGRTQRQTMALKDVHYRIHAKIESKKEFKSHIIALIEQAKRRIEYGKCFYQPYFGCREFPVYFQFADEFSMQKKAQQIDLDIGFMLYDVFDLNCEDVSDPKISIFKAKVKNGILNVPDYNSMEVLKAIKSSD